MIASLRGKLIYADTTSVVVECGGVGMKCAVTQNTLNNLPQLQEEIFLFTHLAVREDALDLYGFLTAEELEAFKLITSVNGVGSKIGIAILSQFSPSQLYLCIAANDPRSLTAANGVGIKLAQRIVLETKDKISNAQSTTQAAQINVVANANASYSEAVEALAALGYSKSEATLAVNKLDSSLPTDELIKQALKALARRF